MVRTSRLDSKVRKVRGSCVCEKARVDILKQKKECLGSSSSVEKKGKGRSVFKLTSNHLLLSFPLLPSFLPKSTNKKVEIHYLSYLVPDCADPYFSLPLSSAMRAPPKIKVVEGRTLPPSPSSSWTRSSLSALPRPKRSSVSCRKAFIR